MNRVALRDILLPTGGGVRGHVTSLREGRDRHDDEFLCFAPLTANLGPGLRYVEARAMAKEGPG